MAKNSAPRGEPAGNKPNAMTDEQEQKLFQTNLAKYERLLKALKDANKAIQDHGKIIKSDHGKHGLKMIKATIALREPETEIDVKEEADAMVRALRWAGIDVGFQGSLFDVEDQTLEERAFADGKRAGLKGDAMSAPVEYGTGDAFQEWCKGWHDGQAVNFGGIKQGPITDETVN